MIRDPIRRTVGRSVGCRPRPATVYTHGKMYTGWGKDGTALLFARYTLPYPWFRTYLHVSRIGGRAWFTQILASEGRRVKIYPSPPSPPLIADHRSARDGKRVKPSDRLFARRINICSSACFYVCPDNFVAHGTRAQVMFAPTSPPSPRLFRKYHREPRTCIKVYEFHKLGML